MLNLTKRSEKQQCEHFSAKKLYVNKRFCAKLFFHTRTCKHDESYRIKNTQKIEEETVFLLFKTNKSNSIFVVKLKSNVY